MRLSILFLILIFWLTTNGQSITGKENGLELGTHLVNRKVKGYNGSHLYPRFSFGYRVSKSSSFEAMVGYLNYGYVSRSVSEIPLSAGYLLNLLPLFIKNEAFCHRVKFNHGLRYTLLLQHTRHKTGDTDLRGHHQVRYVPGIDLYFHKNWGVCYELILGDPNKQVMAFGLKYRL